MSAPTLSMLISGDSSSPTEEGGSNFGATLSDLASGFINRVVDRAADNLADKVVQPVRSSNTQPVPDLAATAAKASSSFTASTVAGISLPILLLGGVALVYILARRR